MKRNTTLAAVALTLLSAGPVAAQGFTVEARGGFNFPDGEFSNRGALQADSDVGLGIGAQYALSPSFGLYGGFAWDRFECQGCGNDARLSTNGLEGGLEVLVPTTWTVKPWVRGGLVWSTAEFDEGELEVSSDRSLGFQVGGGVQFPLGDVIAVRPGVRYQRFDADFGPVEDEVPAFSKDVSFWSVDVAARINFP